MMVHTEKMKPRLVLQDPTNSDKNGANLLELLTAMLEAEMFVSLDQVSNIYLDTFETKLTLKELNGEVAKIVKFNKDVLEFLIMYDMGFPVLGVVCRVR